MPPGLPVQVLCDACPQLAGPPSVEEKGEAFAQPGGGSCSSPAQPCFQHLILSILFAFGVSQHRGGCRLTAARTLLWRRGKSGLFPKYLSRPHRPGTLLPAGPRRGVAETWYP